jgi:hypothetical protein
MFEVMFEAVFEVKLAIVPIVAPGIHRTVAG